ncbi:hypothetical protein Cadr_000007595 [Camelus dromedarius]|uniref:Uncharacterized protein n=1 Tax=Camelus dromedarius TaxID=9838 RepID=A0A5N4E821_CAMDR|nr:hypothetical protein Cadr_000007595 [Camelus dromedarius]
MTQPCCGHCRVEPITCTPCPLCLCSWTEIGIETLFLTVAEDTSAPPSLLFCTWPVPVSSQPIPRHTMALTASTNGSVSARSACRCYAVQLLGDDSDILDLTTMGPGHSPGCSPAHGVGGSDLEMKLCHGTGCGVEPWKGRLRSDKVGAFLLLPLPLRKEMVLCQDAEDIIPLLEARGILPGAGSWAGREDSVGLQSSSGGQPCRRTDEGSGSHGAKLSRIPEKDGGRQEATSHREDVLGNRHPWSSSAGSSEFSEDWGRTEDLRSLCRAERSMQMSIETVVFRGLSRVELTLKQGGWGWGTEGGHGHAQGAGTGFKNAEISGAFTLLRNLIFMLKTGAQRTDRVAGTH